MTVDKSAYLDRVCNPAFRFLQTVIDAQEPIDSVVLTNEFHPAWDALDHRSGLPKNDLPVLFNAKVAEQYALLQEECWTAIGVYVRLLTDRSNEEKCQEAFKELQTKLSDIAVRLNDWKKGAQVGKTDNATLSVKQLAGNFGVPYDALRKRLDRERKKDHDCFLEVSNRRANEPRFLYYVAKVRPIIEDLKASNRTSNERPSPKNKS